MCRKCHSNVSMDEAVRQMEGAMGEPHFDQWNSTSVGHLYMLALGSHELQGRVPALHLLDKFSRWYDSTQRDRYQPPFGLQPMMSKAELRASIDWLEGYKPDEAKTLDERLQDLQSFQDEWHASQKWTCVLQ